MLLQLFGIIFLTAAVTARCPEGYQSYAPFKCLKYVEDEQLFAGARERCLAEGTDLISIHSKEENDAIVAAVSSTRADSIWIGLTCDPEKQTFAWSDGTPVDYLGFESIECTEKKEEFILRYYDGVWVASQPETFYYVCGMDMGDEDTRCDAGYQFEEKASTCLKVVTKPDTWTNADKACADEEAALVSIHNRETNDFVRQMAYKKGLSNGVFIGLQLVNGTPVWSDETEIDYSNFDLGMPNEMFGSCAALLTWILEGSWVSVHCDSLTRLPYVCEKRTDALSSPCPVENTFTNTAEVFSPGYPSSISPGLDCEYFFAAPEGKHVLLEIAELTLSTDDSIRLFEGEASEEPMAVLNSTSIPGIYKTVTDNVMRMVYVTGEGNGVRKWHLQFMTVL